MNLLQLRTKLAAILNRNDATTELLNEFLGMAQTRIERTLRIPGMEKMMITQGTQDVPSDQIVLPPDFLSLKYLYSDCGLMETRDLGHFLRLQMAPGDPRYYVRVGGSLLIKPTLPAGHQTTMVYHAAQPPMVADTDENLFGQIAADLLIYGALSYATDYFVDDRTATFEGRFNQLYDDLDEQARMTDMEQSAMAVSPAYNTDY
jgi:hypothetical protein